jgi:hypothetical protein
MKTEHTARASGVSHLGRVKVITLMLLLVASLLAIGVASGVPGKAQAAPGDAVDFHSLIGNVGGPSPGSPTVAGIGPAGAAWVVGSSEVDLSAAGQLYVSMQGLFLASSLTVGPVTTVQAVLACQTAAGYSTVTTNPVPLNSLGDATINQALTLPAPCYAPIVLIEKGGGTTYFATTGYSTAPSSDIVDFYTMVGNVGGPSPGSPTVAGIGPAGAAWVVGPSFAEIDGATGTLQLSVQGLVLASTLTVGPVTSVQAVLACQTPTGFTTVTTSQVPLNSSGDASIDQAMTLPAPCYAPIVLIEKGGGTTYFASTGYTTAGAPTLLVHSVDQNGNPIYGLAVNLHQSPSYTAPILSTGFTSYRTFLNTGYTYGVTVDSSYGGCTFNRWLDSGNTTDMRPISLTENTEGFLLTAVYTCVQSTLTIDTRTLPDSGSNGMPLTGYYTTLSQNGSQIPESCSFSVCSFTVDNGQTYQVSVSNFGGATFLHWADNMGYLEPWGGIYPVTIPPSSASQTVTLTAVYSP